MNSSRGRKIKFVPKAVDECTLCHKSSVLLAKFETLGEKEKEYIIQHYGKALPANSLICKSHYMEAKRKHSDSNHTPKWAQQITTQAQSANTVQVTCVHPQCLDTNKLITPSFEALDNLKAAMQIDVDPNQPFVLCPSHYHKLYRQFKLLPCAGCGLCPKRESFNRHCPDANMINYILRENAGFNDVNISDSDTICINCYKSHLAIIKSVESESMNPESLLEDLISVWELKYLDDNNDNVTRSLLFVVLYIAREFVNQRAVLLPHVSKMFCQAYDSENTDMNIQLEVSEGTTTFTSKWLLNQLLVYFQDHMKYK